MTFYYYKNENDEQIKYRADIDIKKINNFYREIFDKYSDKREVKFISPKEITIHPIPEVIIKNYSIKKVNDNYEISYTIYNYPKICQIIDNLLNKEKFAETYEYLLSFLVSNRQQQIEEIRKKIDRELRIFNVLLDDEKRDSNFFQKMYFYFQEIHNICNYDKEFAIQAQIVANAIKVQKVNKKDFSKIYVNPLFKKKNKN